MLQASVASGTPEMRGLGEAGECGLVGRELAQHIQSLGFHPQQRIKPGEVLHEEAG